MDGGLLVMAKRSFSPELLESLRSMVVTKALDALGLHWKRDPDFQPVKDAFSIPVQTKVVAVRLIWLCTSCGSTSLRR
jgi:hypothetical protein